MCNYAGTFTTAVFERLLDCFPLKPAALLVRPPLHTSAFPCRGNVTVRSIRKTSAADYGMQSCRVPGERRSQQ
jgi:hypothetical protein